MEMAYSIDRPTFALQCGDQQLSVGFCSVRERQITVLVILETALFTHS